jgi:hypothetical protein
VIRRPDTIAGAVSAQFGTVTLIIGRDIQGGQEGLHHDCSGGKR